MSKENKGEMAVALCDDMGGQNAREELKLKRNKPLVLDELLLKNINTWGNVQYNIPLRLSDNETRTSTSIGLRHIPIIHQNLDVDIKDPLPNRVVGRDMVVNEETYKSTTRSAYIVKPNPNNAMEKYDSAVGNRRVQYMTAVEQTMQEATVVTRPLLTEMKDNYRGIQRPPLAPPDSSVKPPDPEYIFDVVAYGRSEAPCIPETAKGFRRLLDPYFTQYRASYRQYSPDEWTEMKDQINFFTESNKPRVKGFGPRFKEIWQPLTSRLRLADSDRVQFKKEWRGVCSAHNPVKNLPRAFVTENQMKYQVPFAISPLVTQSSGEEPYLAPFPPNPYQTNLAPFMYCSDYCHIGRNAPISVIDQINHVRERPPCRQRYIVSRDETLPSAAKPAPNITALPF